MEPTLYIMVTETPPPSDFIILLGCLFSSSILSRMTQHWAAYLLKLLLTSTVFKTFLVFHDIDSVEKYWYLQKRKKKKDFFSLER